MFVVNCGGKETRYEEEKRSEVMEKYFEGIFACEGHESERYKQIYFDLKIGRNYCSDENV